MKFRRFSKLLNMYPSTKIIGIAKKGCEKLDLVSNKPPMKEQNTNKIEKLTKKKKAKCSNCFHILVLYH